MSDKQNKTPVSVSVSPIAKRKRVIRKPARYSPTPLVISRPTLADLRFLETETSRENSKMSLQHSPIIPPISAPSISPASIPPSHVSMSPATTTVTHIPHTLPFPTQAPSMMFSQTTPLPQPQMAVPPSQPPQYLAIPTSKDIPKFMGNPQPTDPPFAPNSPELDVIQWLNLIDTYLISSQIVNDHHRKLTLLYNCNPRYGDARQVIERFLTPAYATYTYADVKRELLTAYAPLSSSSLLAASRNVLSNPVTNINPSDPATGYLAQIYKNCSHLVDSFMNRPGYDANLDKRPMADRLFEFIFSIQACHLFSDDVCKHTVLQRTHTHTVSSLTYDILHYLKNTDKPTYRPRAVPSTNSADVNLITSKIPALMSGNSDKNNKTRSPVTFNNDKPKTSSKPTHSSFYARTPHAFKKPNEYRPTRPHTLNMRTQDTSHGQGNRYAPARKHITCFNCSGTGHMANVCPSKNFRHKK